MYRAARGEEGERAGRGAAPGTMDSTSHPAPARAFRDGAPAYPGDGRPNIPLPATEERAAARTGLAYALLSYGVWGVLPAYWKLFQGHGVPAHEVLAHRMVWSVPVLLALLALLGRLRELAAALRPGRNLAFLCGTALILALNWGLYIHGVTTNRIVETSLGYFINPLLNVALGALFLRERLSVRQWGAVALAALGVAALVLGLGAWPWIALSIALSFSVYGLLRKVAPAAPLVGLAVETLLLAPFALGFLALHHAQGHGGFAGTGAPLDLLLASTGLATTLPLLWFALAGKRLRYATLGLVQYIAPTLQFALGTLRFGEPFTRVHAVAFAFIWAGVALYAADLLAQERRLRRAVGSVTISVPARGAEGT